MGNKYKDDHGHFTSKENDGGPCHHDEGGDDRGVSKESWNKFSKKTDEWEKSDEAKKSHDKAQRRIDYIKDLKSKGVDQDEAIEKANRIYDEGGFDDDYDEEFEDEDNDIDNLIDSMKKDGVNVHHVDEVKEWLGATAGYDKDDQETIIGLMYDNSMFDGDYVDDDELMKGSIYYTGDNAYKITEVNDEEVEFIDKDEKTHIVPIQEFRDMVESDEFDTTGLTREEAEDLGIDFDTWGNEDAAIHKSAQEQDEAMKARLKTGNVHGDEKKPVEQPSKNTPERKFIRYPNGQIRWKDEIYPDEGSLEDIAGSEALKEIVDANDEENEERNFENEIEKRFDGWRPHWTNRKKNGGAHFEHDAFLNSFDYDNKVYKNTDERIKWNRDMADFYRKNGQENSAKEYEDNASFIEKNKDRFAKYEKQANESRGRRWLQLYGEDARVSELKRGLKDGKYSVEDLITYLKGE